MDPEIRYIERVIPKLRTHFTVARMVRDENAPLETYSVHLLIQGIGYESARDGIVFREHGKWYAQDCDEYGFPTFPLLRALRLYTNGLAARGTFMDAVELLIGRKPRTTLRVVP